MDDIDYTTYQVPDGYHIEKWIDGYCQGQAGTYLKAIGIMLEQGAGLGANYIVQVCFQERPGVKVAGGIPVIVAPN